MYSMYTRRMSARALVHRALDLGPDLDVAAQEVVVPLAERLRVTALARLRAPRLGELVEARHQLLRVGERLDDPPRRRGLDQLDVAVVGRPHERQHDHLLRQRLETPH